MRILICTDSFKGSLTSFQAANAIKKGIEKARPGYEIITVPLADGGEGTGDCLKNAVGGKYIETETENIFFEKMKAKYLLLENSEAFIETASASGLTTVEKHRLNPLKASSVGTGILIKKAVGNGAKKVTVALGGSAVNDGGMGALSALGVRFFDKDKNLLLPVGENMIKADSVGFTQEYLKYKNVKFTLACDVENPFYGKNGAAYVFSSQKGASESDIEILDRGLEKIEKVFALYSGKNVQSVRGSGAAGGLCGGLYAFFDCEIKNGFDILSEAYSLEEKIASADLIITGEGRTDSQTAFGKLPMRISSLSKKHNKTCVLVSGDIEEGFDFKQLGFTRAYKIKNESVSLENAMKNAYNLLVELSEKIEVAE